MSFNPAGAVDVSLSVFGSLVTEMAPMDLPEGVSPDNGDVVYAPGNVQSRPGLQKVFVNAFPGNVSVLWAKSFVRQTGIENLYLTSDGKIWLEDFSNAPGIATQFAQTTPGALAKSITAFGREYIAFSDGLHGQDVPLQWDGTFLDRVTQDGPGVAPAVASIALPSVAMVATGAPATLPVTEADPGGITSGGSFTQINFWTPNDVSGVAVGSFISITGNASAAMNVTNAPVIAVYTGGGGPYANLIVLSKYSPAGTQFGLGGTATIGSGVTITRANNVVTVKTAAAHQLQPGYRAQISGMPAAAVGTSITSAVINNENQPGLATITTSTAHGLVPGISVAITGITAVVVGTGISSLAREGNVVTVTTSAAHGLTPGAVVTLAGVGTASFNTTAPVLQVLSPTVFTFAQVDADATVGAGGTVSLNWPIPQSSTPTYFQVLAVPTATTFQVQVNYSDGSWGAGGSVTYAWNGTFFVLSTPTSTTFTYQQYGPNATASTVGTVTPYGQAAPGIHQMQVLFLTRQGYTTRPSPPVNFVANGGQYISVTNIPIGPPNVVARILAFTGAGGAYFFYIPATPQVNGQIVGTSTQINDNVTTDAVLDFGDNTLFASLGISIPGNNLANQITLDGALGFGFYGSRLIAWGQRNRIQNLLNLGFDGGYLPRLPTIPTGWKVTGVPGVLAAGHYGQGFQIGTGSIYQSFYQDAYGAPIGTPNTPYRLRAWVQGGAVMVTISSASTGFTSSANLAGTANGSFVEAAFSLPMPATIPPDMILSVTGAGALIDEISIIYAQTPYLDGILYGSYVNNPEGFDGVSGKFGPATDTRKVMDLGIIRNTLYLFTQEPSGRIHATNDNGVTEPAGWTISQVGANCGVLSAFCLTKSQSDDASAGGGEEWLAWASSSGARIFGGDQPWKVSQEIQPDWANINAAAAIRVWALNDPVARVIYFGLPTGPFSSPNLIYPMNYRELDTPYQIFVGAPFHPSFSGHLIATDNTRKWTRWHLAMNGAALLYRGARQLSLVLLGNFGNVYTLNPAKLTDDDYGQIFPYYITYFHVQGLQEQALRDAKGQPLGGGRKLLAYLTAFASGVGTLKITAYCDSLTNPWPLIGQRTLSLNPKFDLEWTGGNAQGQRIALKFASSPLVGTDNSFNLNNLVVSLKRAAHLPVRGAA